MAGFASNTHPYHVRTGHWIREYRGNCRLADYPLAERPDLTVGFLWSRNRHENPQGVYSYETALSLYELSDANPRKLHMAVPRKFRRMAPPPPMIILHRADIPIGDTQEILGVRCTTPMRSMIDLAGVPRTDTALLRQAVREALARGLVRRDQLVREDLPPCSAAKSKQSLALMPEPREYRTAASLRTPLETRLQTLAKIQQADVQHLNAGQAGSSRSRLTETASHGKEERTRASTAMPTNCTGFQHLRRGVRESLRNPPHRLQKEGQKGCRYVSKLLKRNGPSGRTRTSYASVNRIEFSR